MPIPKTYIPIPTQTPITRSTDDAGGHGSPEHDAHAGHHHGGEGSAGRLGRGTAGVPKRWAHVLHVPHPDARALLLPDAAGGGRPLPRDGEGLRDAPLLLRRSVPILRELAFLPGLRGTSRKKKK